MAVLPTMVDDALDEGEVIEVQDEAQDDPGETEEQEVEAQKKAHNPILPSAEEIDDHLVSGHYPYRSWCQPCIEGRAVSTHHRRAQRDARGKMVATISFDYFFMTEKGLRRREEMTTDFPGDAEGNEKLEDARRRGDIVKVILLKCDATKIVLGHTVPCKGLDEELHVVKLIVQDIAWIGHTRVMLKSDNERSVVKLVRTALKEAKVECPEMDQIGEEHPESYDSRSHGSIEMPSGTSGHTAEP